MNREQWQTKRGQHAGLLPPDRNFGVPAAMGPVALDLLGIPVPANDALMRRVDAESCCEWSLIPANELSLRR